MAKAGRVSRTPGCLERRGTGADTLCLVITLDSFARRCLRASALPIVTAAALVSAPAQADVPEGWSNPEEVDMLGALLLLGGVPLLLFVLITLAVYLPAMVRGDRLTPDHKSPQAQWLGGPQPGGKELGGVSEPSETGGAGGRW